MEEALRRAVEKLLAEGGTATTVRSARTVSGGSINRAWLLTFEDGRRRFLKANPGAPEDMFPREAEGLRALARPGVLRVPRDPIPGEAGGTPFLLMEAVDTGRPGRGFSRRFGRLLATLHQGDQAPRFGFEHDNYLGATPQPNSWCDDWCDFWRRHRLGHQLRLARHGGRSDPELERLGERLLDRLEQWIAEPAEPPCLLHGDLWGGNYLVDEEGQPVLIDPAPYYGRREAELAMTRLFGGFDQDFYQGYEEVWPLEPGSRERLDVYTLYHLLNHLNLFGRGYRDGCVRVLRWLVQR